MQSEDEQLITSYAEQGDERAFACFISKHHDLVTRIVHSRVDAPEGVNDITQTVFTLLAKKSSKLKSHPAIAPWLIRTAILEAKRYNRQRTNRMKREADYAERRELDDPAPAFTQEERETLDLALTQLPDKQRECIIMRYYSGCSFEEIARHTSKSSGATQRMISRSVERLRELDAERFEDRGCLGSIGRNVGREHVAADAKTRALCPESLGLSLGFLLR